MDGEYEIVQVPVLDEVAGPLASAVVVVAVVAAGRPRAFQPNRAKHKSTLTAATRTATTYPHRWHGTPTTQDQDQNQNP